MTGEGPVISTPPPSKTFVAEVSNVCEMPEVDTKELNEFSSHWLRRREDARKKSKSKLWIVRHIDDYSMMGPKAVLQQWHSDMEKDLQLRDITWLDDNNTKAQLLGWILARVADGFDVCVNPELAQEIVNDSGLASSTRKTSTPGLKERVFDETPLDDADHKYYRTQVGRLLFYAALRPDLQFAVSQVSKQVKAPCVGHMICLKRLIRYLGSTLTHVLRLRPRGRKLRIEAWSDSDWAGSADRRSTSAGVVMLNGACVLSFSRIQACRALSSCEAELYALGSTAAECLLLASFLAEQKLCDEAPLLRTDSSSALQLSG